MLFSIDDFYNLYELNPAVATEPVVVAELGAGWGRLGYVLLKVNPKATYVIFDLPEVLLVSQSYLPTLLPDLTVGPYSQSHTLQPSRRSLAAASVWFFGPQQMEQFQPGSIDYIVNIASFQEMPMAFVREYMRLFSRQAAGGYCYLRQLYEGNFHGHRLDEIQGLQEYPFPGSWRKEFLRPTKLSDEFFEGGFAIP